MAFLYKRGQQGAVTVFPEEEEQKERSKVWQIGRATLTWSCQGTPAPHIR